MLQNCLFQEILLFLKIFVLRIFFPKSLLIQNVQTFLIKMEGKDFIKHSNFLKIFPLKRENPEKHMICILWDQLFTISKCVLLLRGMDLFVLSIMIHMRTFLERDINFREFFEWQIYELSFDSRRWPRIYSWLLKRQENFLLLLTLILLFEMLWSKKLELLLFWKWRHPTWE